ncbi:MAG: ABC transporter permease [Chloroflexi bacterium]|nr:ABC transporter permease [Chloroflexota bacterium]
MTRREAFGKASRAWWRGIASGQELGVFIVLVAMVLYLTWQTDTFATTQNIRNIWLSFSWIAIAAFGQTFVIITGGIDLSTGSTMALAGLAAAFLISGNIEGQPSEWMIEKTVGGRTQQMGPDEYVPIALLAGPLMGLLIGTVNGLLVAWAGLPAFIATLGMMSVARGVCYGWSSGWPFQKLNNEFLRVGQENLSLSGFDIPLPFIIMIVLALLMSLFLTRTVWGYRIYALGGNEQAAQLSGINTSRVKLMAFMISGLMAGIGGTLMTARLGVAAPTAAQGYELDAIAAVFIGGTSVTGGKGTIVGTLIGAAIMQVLRSGLNLLGYDPYWQPAAIGLTIILAIMFDRLRVRLQNRPATSILGLEELRSRLGR